MVVRIHNIGKWRKVETLKGKQVLQLPGTGNRKVILQLNCAGETRVDLVELERDDARATFLWAGRGMEELEFYARGVVHVVCDSEHDVYYFTNERAGTAIKNVEPVSFTKIANRRARNPELDAIMLRAEINMNRRLARLEQEMERKYGGAGRRIDMATGEVTDETPSDGNGHAGGSSEPEDKPEGGTPPKAAQGQPADAGADAANPPGASDAE